MATWSNNHKACTNTWGVLAALQQHDEPFDDAEKLKMSGLLFWNPLESAELREIHAKALAAQMDGVFRKLLRAEFEDKVTATKAVNAMTSVLTDKAQKLPDLAASVDDLYHFLDE